MIRQMFLEMIEPRMSEVLGARRHCSFMIAKNKRNVKNGGMEASNES